MEMGSKERIWITGGAVVVIFVAAVSFYYWRRPATELGKLIGNYGYVELQPPSRLLSPGTWITVTNQDPLTVGVLCAPMTALGIGSPVGNEGNVIQSSSVDSSFQREIRDSFSISQGLLEKLRTKQKLSSLKEISFTLSNVRVLEIPDDIVHEGLKKRTASCRQALVARLHGNQSVSMVKSVLMADVAYDFEFDDTLSAEIEAAAKREAALELSLQIEAADSGKEQVVGRDLVWGVREDPVLARAGLEIGDVGGRTEAAVVLPPNEPIVTVETLCTKLPPDDMIPVVNHEVSPIRQVTTMGCWATVYAMMLSWKEKREVGVEEALEQLEAFSSYYYDNSGLPVRLQEIFVETMELEIEPPANYTLSFYHRKLDEHGPLWVITGNGINAHAKLLTALYASEPFNNETPLDSVVFEFIDPAVGCYMYQPALEFMEEFEREARYIVDRDMDHQPLRGQILSWPR